ncbi:MAG: hypothetical protein NZ874_00075 [Fimbriimonadales bacterium]|nr:hypothetical protein [Fimbriimonadales bacterium]
MDKTVHATLHGLETRATQARRRDASTTVRRHPAVGGDDSLVVA